MTRTPTATAAAPTLRGYLRQAIKVLVSVGLLALLLRSVDGGAVWQVVQGMQHGYLVPALVLQLLSATVASYRWYLIMRALGYSQRPQWFFRSYLKGTFFSQALPTSIGGDAYRVIEVSRLGHGKRQAFYGVVIDRIVGLLGLLLLNLIANLIHPELLPRPVFWLLNLISAGGIAGVIAFALAGRIRRYAHHRLLKLPYEFSQRIRSVYATPRAMVVQTALSLLIHLLAMLVVFFIGRGVGLPYDLLTFLVMVPPVILLTIVPISLAGWGVREGGMVGLFMLIGADQTRVLSMSLIYGFVLLLASLPGMVLFVGRRRRR